MNTQTNSDRKLAEALRALPLDPLAGDDDWKSPRASRSLTLALGTFVLCATAGLVFWNQARTGSGNTRFLAQDSAPVAGASASSTSPASAVAADHPRAAATAGAQAAPSPVPQALPGGEITGSGYVVAPTQTVIHAKYAGEVTALPVQLGDRVTKGQILLQLTDAEAEFSLQAARIALSSAQTALAGDEISLRQAEKALARAQQLHDRGNLAQQDLDTAQTDRDSARNSVSLARESLASAELTLKQAQNRADRLTLRAPFAGVITALEVHLGDSVLAQEDAGRTDSALMTITDTDDLEIDADVSETRIAALSPGQEGQAVLDGYPDHPFPVRITRVEPTISADKGTVGLRLSFSDPPDGIRPNMAASIRLVTPSPSPVPQQGSTP